jgi:hypothetical protein
MRGCPDSHSDWREFNKWFSMNILGSYLVFKRELRKSRRAGRHIGRFLEYDLWRSPPTKKFYPEPHHPSVSLMDVQKDSRENERNKGD